mmetsp:Transcript_67187/g.104975  ORF Transcript_67187/g.104975 Transcript_67187/m.104975 type:complete len:932 (+) Transcript_67187:136-2931(+)
MRAGLSLPAFIYIGVFHDVSSGAAAALVRAATSDTRSSLKSGQKAALRKKLRRQRSLVSDNEDPEIAEAMRLAEQAEAEVMNEGSSDIAPVAGAAADENAPHPSKKAVPPVPAALSGAVDAQWGATVRAAIKSLSGNTSKKVDATPSTPPSKTKLNQHKMPISPSVSAKAPVADPVQGALDHHAALRSAARSVYGAMSGERRDKKPGGRSEARGSARPVGDIARDPVPKVSYVASPQYVDTLSRTRAGVAPYEDKADFDVAMAYEDEEDGLAEEQASLSVVRPGLASGQAVPYVPPAQQENVERYEAKALRTGVSPIYGQSSGLASNVRKRRVLHEVEQLEEKIAKETNSESLALMLGGVKMDLYQLHETVDMLHKDIEDGVIVDPHGSLHDNFVYPLSVCMRCVFLLAAQYFLLYTALAICKAFVDLFELSQEYTRGEKAIRSACDTVSYAPMLCVLFVGAHLRALQISLGRRGPQEWADTAIQVCTWSVIIQTVLVLVIPAVISDEIRRPQDAGQGLALRRNPSLAGLLTFFRYLTLAGLYVGFTMVCIAVVLMDAPSLGAEPINIWDDPTTAEIEYAPPVSTAMRATIVLTLFFFFVHLLHAVAWTCRELAGGVQSWAARSEKCLDACLSTVNLAPMLCVLFIAARMRALQMDPTFGRPQPWAEACFGICVVSIIVQTFLIILANVLGGRSVASDPSIEASRSQGSQKVVLAFSYLVMAATYVASFVVLYGIFSMKAKDGNTTPPLSPTMICVMTLVVLYLGVYFCLFLSQVATESGAGEYPGRREAMQRMLNICKMAENTVKFGPMLAILFVAARMRALQLSQQKGSPQCWAQDAMYLTCAAVVLQLFMVMVSGALSSAVEVDDSGNLLAMKMRYLPGRIFLEFLKAITFFMLYGGIIAVVTSIVVIRPETATCSKYGFGGFASTLK